MLGRLDVMFSLNQGDGNWQKVQTFIEEVGYSAKFVLNYSLFHLVPDYIATSHGDSIL